ncbi:MAG: Imm72 family immunity protein, partial [Succiniclasticum sp.]
MMSIEKTKYPMSDEQVRRKLFWLLQRLSSYTLWQRKRDAWAHFTQQFEQALKTWPEEITKGFHPKAIIWAYDALRLYDEGLPELAVGNRQVWQIKTGEFDQLFRPVSLIEKYFYWPCHDERGGQREPYPPEIEKINQWRVAAEFWGDNLLYPPQNNVCNFFDAEYLLEPKNYIYNLTLFAYPVFPKNLSPVPERSDIIIKTDDPVPCDGIWEPVKIQYNHKLLVIKDGTRLHLFSNASHLTPGMVLETGDSGVPELKEGMVITLATFRAARDTRLHVSVWGMSYSEQYCFRPEPAPRPLIAGTLTA